MRSVQGVQRITPACAGRSDLTERFVQLQADHPRVCGEKRVSEKRPKSPYGSPPRVRGEAFFTVLFRCNPGITPACAGRRGCDQKQMEKTEDHPRVCGEKQED